MSYNASPETVAQAGQTILALQDAGVPVEDVIFDADAFRVVLSERGEVQPFEYDIGVKDVGTQEYDIGVKDTDPEE